jgi:hypothetical protein
VAHPPNGHERPVRWQLIRLDYSSRGSYRTSHVHQTRDGRLVTVDTSIARV